MLLADLLLSAATTLAAMALGAMLLFAAVVTPAAFATLGPELAARYLRGLFPRYYLAVALVCFFAAALAGVAPFTAPEESPKALWPLPAAAALCVAASLFARQVLTPRINAARDRMHDGDAAAGDAFRRLHRGSVLLHLVQMIALVAGLGWTLLG
ncbi:DUF4149 domain-containing protein [uncultured Alsobacter sp.]|uniref:DUF4149 domain-containing protein n=1 Tax=uncultured Alsobacter sp. TaxID=1748258 RepID=UPI0025FA38F5|nr:DUF4149 domain-containing protein [uncultured Alsobacter sp.]